MQNEPNWGRGPRGEECETNPIRPSWQAGRGRGERKRAKRTQSAPGCRHRWDECAKQSQFPTVGISHHSSVLSFHHSNPMPNVQNKPNSPPAGREDHRQEPALSAANGPLDMMMPSVTGATAPNKANSVRESRAKCFLGQELWCIGHERKTKPISGRAGWAGAPRGVGRGKNVRNEPTSRRRHVGRGMADEGQTCKTKPISPAGARSGGRGARGECAKRTQFGPSRASRAPIIPIFHHFSIPSFRPCSIVLLPPRFRPIAHRVPFYVARRGS